MFDIEKYKAPEPIYDSVSFFTDSQLYQERGGVLLYDIETYQNFFFIAFKSFATGRITSVELSEWEKLNTAKLRWIVDNFTIVGFNNRNYDDVLLWASLAGLTNEGLKNISDSIIVGKIPAYKLEKEFGFKVGFTNSIDLQQVAPSAAAFCSLKHYGARMHVAKLQDLPINPHKLISYEDSFILRNYCYNDLTVTGWLKSKLLKAIDLRREMGMNYGADLRSLSDAQIAERVIAVEIKATTGQTPTRPQIKAGTTFQFQNPDYLRFYSADLQKLHNDILQTVFVVDDHGKVRVVKDYTWITATNLWSIKIGKSVYRLGIGGLHSSEQSKSHYSDEETLLIDRDVASYYPAIILNQGLYPQHIGRDFLTVYKDIVDRRLLAKKLGDKSTANSLKIVANGSFGKLGSKWSVFYSPDLLIQVTITGQLSLLMLIEMLHWYGIPVVSANTDGIVIKCPKAKFETYNQVVAQWEAITSFVTEETEYKSLHSRDVNNYIAVTLKNDFKAKGSYVNGLSMKEPDRESLMKNPNGTICSEAVMKFLATCRDPNPVTIESTIKKCKDFSKFIFIRRVKGGAVKDNVYIGKVIRWYMRYKEFGCIKYLEDNVHGTKNTVSETTGSYPCMDISGMPNDIDYDWYIRRSHSILKDLGYYSTGESQLTLW